MLSGEEPQTTSPKSAAADPAVSPWPQEQATFCPLFKQYYKRINSSSVKDDPSAKAEAQHNEHKAGSKEKRKEKLGEKLEIKWSGEDAAAKREMACAGSCDTIRKGKGLQ